MTASAAVAERVEVGVAASERSRAERDVIALSFPAPIDGSDAAAGEKEDSTCAIEKGEEAGRPVAVVALPRGEEKRSVAWRAGKAVDDKAKAETKDAQADEADAAREDEDAKRPPRCAMRESWPTREETIRSTSSSSSSSTAPLPSCSEVA